MCAASICSGPGASRAGLGLACCCSLEPHLKLLCVEFRDMPCNTAHSMMLGLALHTSQKTYRFVPDVHSLEAADGRLKIGSSIILV